MQTLLAIPYIFWLIASAICFAFGEYFSKKFGLTPNWYYVTLVFGSYMLGTAVWLPAIVQKNQLSIVGAIWSVLSLIATVLIGVLFFSEKLNTLSVLGLLLGLISVFLLSIA
jgi:multidrug transporter EmrE-like cation transporter